MPSSVDLNCDLGEDSSAEGRAREEAVLAFVSSINVACGLHAGDAHVMRRLMRLAAQKGIAVGAHPSLADREHFGRRELPVTAEEVYELVIYQLGAAQAIARSAGTRLAHVKAHGALYNMAARDATLARAIAEAVRDFDARLVMFGLSGSSLIAAAEAAGLRSAAEVFADRTYQADGSLTPRSRPDALIHDEDAAAAQVLQMIEQGTVRAVDGRTVKVRADTICIHGDAPQAPAFAARLRRALESRGVQVRPVAAIPA
ncbi:MAG TPA: 5-oxoprolinase subunit PxpA [Burkholderiales bacterium]|jgi:UPF0271 protein|nr:5-oxoprolinase subunit PxpA [Burkholderiales bacterium]